MKYLKLSAIIFALSLALTASGCGESPQTLYNPDSTESSRNTENEQERASSEEDTPQDSDNSEISSEQIGDSGDDDYSEYYKGDSKYPLRNFMTKMAAEEAASGLDGYDVVEQSLMDFTECTDSDSLKRVDKENLPVDNGIVKMDLNLLMYSYTDDADYNIPAVMLLTVNGKPYDFSVDGKKSSSGILTMDIPVDTDIVLPFDMSNVPVQKGENEMTFWIVPYSTERALYLSPQCFTGYWDAEAARDGDAPADFAAESSLSVNTESTDGKSKDQLTTYIASLDNYDPKYRVKTGDDFRHVTLKSDTKFSFPIQNINNDLGPSNRAGICLALNNGRPMPAFGGKTAAILSFSDHDYLKTVAVDSDFHAGDQAVLQFCFLEYQNDKLMFDQYMSTVSPVYADFTD
ncbi:MAG: hypothetical protein IKQ91_02645 [Oscillospiraceae bacterium]|nr:hypothetical protein [Oscillospiraceae bacterium]